MGWATSGRHLAFRCQGRIRAIAAPVVANQVLASASAIFSWAMKEEFGGVTENPCRLIDRTKRRAGNVILSDSEIATVLDRIRQRGACTGARH